MRSLFLSVLIILCGSEVGCTQHKMCCVDGKCYAEAECTCGCKKMGCGCTGNQAPLIQIEITPKTDGEKLEEMEVPAPPAEDDTVAWVRRGYHPPRHPHHDHGWHGPFRPLPPVIIIQPGCRGGRCHA